MGCCGGRDIDGDPVFSSKTDTLTKAKIALNAGNIEVLTQLFSQGWRIHHFFEENNIQKSFLSIILYNDKFSLLKSNFMTLSEKCLDESIDGKKNYEVIFENDEIMRQISKNYIDTYAFEITNQGILNAFFKSSETSLDKELWQKLICIFGLENYNKNKSDSNNSTVKENNNDDENIKDE